MTIRTPTNEPDKVIKIVSEAILRKLNPYVLADYISSSDHGHDIPGAIAIVRELINNSSNPTKSISAAVLRIRALRNILGIESRKNC